MDIKQSKRAKFLVFTSAGDNSNINCWLDGVKNFDLWVTYYGENQGKYSNLSDIYNIRKGGKFPNFYFAFNKWREIFNNYEAIMIMDDDIIIDGTNISRLFEIREKFDLWILQPAFSPNGKISHAITCVNSATSLRFTNFIELNCPLFKKDKLDLFMKVYDPILVGWGIDWWFLDVIRTDNYRRIAIIDSISCINPFDVVKNNQREVDILQTSLQREESWNNIKKSQNIKSDESGYITYGSLPNSINEIREDSSHMRKVKTNYFENCLGIHSIEKCLVDFISSQVKSGSNILEFGSGIGTELLLLDHNVTSIEHDEIYCYRRTMNHQFHFAPINSNWYSRDIVKTALDSKYDLILMDGPSNLLIAGLLPNVDLFRDLKIPILFNGIELERNKVIMIHFCSQINYSYKIFKGNKKDYALCELIR